MQPLESRLNFAEVEHRAPTNAVKLKADQTESYYVGALSDYCSENNIDMSADNASAMIMSDYAPDGDFFYFWID